MNGSDKNVQGTCRMDILVRLLANNLSSMPAILFNATRSPAWTFGEDLGQECPRYTLDGHSCPSSPWLRHPFSLKIVWIFSGGKVHCQVSFASIFASVDVNFYQDRI